MDISNLIKLPDTLFSQVSLKIRPEKKSLIVLLLHGLFKDEQEIKQNHMDPQLGITLKRFQNCISYFQENQYHFITPKDLLNGLDGQQNHVLITFDDGYYNNIHALPILQDYDIPAVFFVSSYHIEHQESYWWDIIYRNRIQQGVTMTQILLEQEQLKPLKHTEIRSTIIDRFGKDALVPFGDIDRPMTIKELQTFSSHPQVYIGNHTRDHAILTNYSIQEIEEQITASQRFITTVTGSTPQMISYPNGNYSSEIISLSKKHGLQLGFTVEQKKNLLAGHNTYDPFEMGRFELTQQGSLNQQIDLMRSDLVGFRFVQNILQTKKQE